MAIDATIGGTSSDSYVTVAQADSYHADHLYTTKWTTSNSKQETALKMATRLLDERVSWSGSVATTTQSLRWPRSNVYTEDNVLISSLVIPPAVINATSELARHLINSDLTVDTEGKGIKSLDVDTISLEFDKSDSRDVLPQIVVEMLRGYGSINSRSKFGTVAVIRS